VVPILFSGNGSALIRQLANYVNVIEDRPILSAEYLLPLLAKTDPPAARSLSTIAELLVSFHNNTVLCIVQLFVNNLTYFYT